MLTTYKYPDQMVGERCEQLAGEINQIDSMVTKITIQARIEIGKRLNEIRNLLGYGEFGKWLSWRLPEWSEESTRRWRVMAERSERNPKLLEILGLFHSTAAAEEYVCLPEPQQALVIEKEAYTWNEFRAVTWDATMRERLADDGLNYDNRHGDVLHAIEEAKHDPALQEVAETLYLENREQFARLADREPAEIDVEVGVGHKEPAGNAPSAQLIEGDIGRYWYMEWTGTQPFPLDELRRLGFINITVVEKRLVMWSGSGAPVTLAPYPITNDGPVGKSWQNAVIDASCRRVNASTMKKAYGEVL